MKFQIFPFIVISVKLRKLITKWISLKKHVFNHWVYSKITWKHYKKHLKSSETLRSILIWNVNVKKYWYYIFLRSYETAALNKLDVCILYIMITFHFSNNDSTWNYTNFKSTNMNHLWCRLVVTINSKDMFDINVMCHRNRVISSVEVRK